MIWNHLSVEHPINAQFHFCGIPNFSGKNWRIIIFSTSISHKFEQVNICENSHLCCKLEALKFDGGKKTSRNMIWWLLLTWKFPKAIEYIENCVYIASDVLGSGIKKKAEGRLFNVKCFNRACLFVCYKHISVFKIKQQRIKEASKKKAESGTGGGSLIQDREV